MRHVDAQAIAANLPVADLIKALKDAAGMSITAPPRQIVQINPTSKLLMMPAFAYRSRMGVKVISVFDDNKEKPFETIQGLYCLFDSDTGTPLATLDGAELTARRTAATSALAASLLADENANEVAIAGAGKLLPYFIEAYTAIRPKASFRLWARDIEGLKRREENLARVTSSQIAIFETFEGAVAGAQIISTISSAREPILRGAWLRPGAHIDLVGAHTPEMAEADPECFKHAKVFVDSKEAALEEAGDLMAAIAGNAMGENDICGDLFDLCSGRAAFARGPDDITLFKSVGHAFEDLVAATLVAERLG